MRAVVTKAKTGAGIARAFLNQHWHIAPAEWSAGGNAPKNGFSAIEEAPGVYRLTAVSIFNGKPAGRVYGPRFIVKAR